MTVDWSKWFEVRLFEQDPNIVGAWIDEPSAGVWCKYCAAAFEIDPLDRYGEGYNYLPILASDNEQGLVCDKCREVVGV